MMTQYLPLDPRRVGVTQRFAADLTGATPVTINRAVLGGQRGQAREALAAMIAAMEPLSAEDRRAYIERVRDLGHGVAAVLIAAVERLQTEPQRADYLRRLHELRDHDA